MSSRLRDKLGALFPKLRGRLNLTELKQLAKAKEKKETVASVPLDPQAVFLDPPTPKAENPMNAVLEQASGNVFLTLQPKSEMLLSSTSVPPATPSSAPRRRRRRQRSGSASSTPQVGQEQSVDSSEEEEK